MVQRQYILPTAQLDCRRHKKKKKNVRKARLVQPFSNDSNAGELTVLVGYDVRIDVIDRLLGLRVNRGGCTCIRRLAYDGSVLWTSGSAGGVLPVERRQDSSDGQGQKGRHGCQAQQQRIQHRWVGGACRDSRCKMLDQLELLSISRRAPVPRPLAQHTQPLFPDPTFCSTPTGNSQLGESGARVTFLSSLALSRLPDVCAYR